MFSCVLNFWILTFVLNFVRGLHGIVQSNPVRFQRAPEMIQSNGYPVESHVVQTTDGYLLTVHRIPYGKAPQGGPREDKPVVLLVHGILSSSTDFVVIGPENALGYLLADQGYDVWMGNCRGNTYSRRHITLNPDTSSKFWDFSFHEVALYDLPATFDYILKKTGQKKLSYVGHSQGTTSMFAMLSLLPSYNNFIISAHALAPAVLLGHLKNPAVHIAINILDKFGLLIGYDESLENFEALPSNYITQLTGNVLCRDGSPVQEFCVRLMHLFFGDDPMQINRTLIPLFTSNVPAGASFKSGIHFFQLSKSGHFRPFDYGPAENMKKYGSRAPPDYPLERITAPISLHYGENDWDVAAEDVEVLGTRIKNLIGAFPVPFAKFNHADFLIAKDAKTLVYDDLIALINKFNKN